MPSNPVIKILLFLIAFMAKHQGILHSQASTLAVFYENKKQKLSKGLGDRSTRVVHTSALCTLWAFTVGSGTDRTRTDISADLEDRGVACTAGSKRQLLLPTLAVCPVISGLDYFSRAI